MRKSIVWPSILVVAIGSLVGAGKLGEWLLPKFGFDRVSSIVIGMVGLCFILLLVFLFVMGRESDKESEAKGER